MIFFKKNQKPICKPINITTETKVCHVLIPTKSLSKLLLLNIYFLSPFYLFNLDNAMCKISVVFAKGGAYIKSICSKNVSTFVLDQINATKVLILCIDLIEPAICAPIISLEFIFIIIFKCKSL